VSGSDDRPNPARARAMVKNDILPGSVSLLAASFFVL
jgi:hypothetical protein